MDLLINPETDDIWQTGLSWRGANQESCQRGFSWGPAGSWTEVSPGGDSSAWQTYRRAEPGERLGTGSGAGILVEQWLAPAAREADHTTHTHTNTHTCWGANRGWQGGLLLKSCCCLEMAFMWMGALIGVVWRLSPHAERRVILFCRVLINKQCLKATMHLEGQHSDSLVASTLFVFESNSNTHWGDHISWEVLTLIIFSLFEKNKDWPECCGSVLILGVWTGKSMLTITFSY